MGDQGQIGDVEIQDLIITTKGATAGAILIEWNMQASSAGSAGMWDVHVRVGGATGTGLTPDECPALLNGVNARCNAASFMMHLTPSASGYFENIWLWVSDHDVEYVDSKFLVPWKRFPEDFQLTSAQRPQSDRRQQSNGAELGLCRPWLSG